MYFYGFNGLFGIFYYIVIPIWLIVITTKLNKANAKIDELISSQRIGQTLSQIPSASSKKLEHWDERMPSTQHANLTSTPMTAADEEMMKRAADDPVTTAESQKSEKSFEELVGANWFQWIGIAALILALLFFLKWTFDNGWIGPVGRTVIGYILAGIAIGAGDKLRKKYGTWSLSFTGGGALSSYIITWIALHHYHLFPAPAAFAINVLTTVVVCLLAGYYKVLPLAAFGIIGGFITPILAGDDGTIVSLLLYILIFDLGVLALGHVTQWRVLNTITFVGTLLWEFYALNKGGYGSIVREHAIIFIAAFGAIYLLVPAIYNVMQKKKSEEADLLILLGNGIAHFGLLVMWLQKTPGLREKVDAPVALLFAVIFLIFSFGVYIQNKKDATLVMGSLSLTVLFASIAIPLQLNGVWISLAWSVEAAFLLWVSLSLNDKRIQIFAWPVMGAAYFWYLFIPTDGGGHAVAFLPSGFWLFLFWVFFLVAIAYIALAQKDRKEQNHLLPFALAGVAILILALFMNTLEGGKSSLDFIGRLTEAAGIVIGSYIVLFQAHRKRTQLSAEEQKGFAILGIVVQIVTLSFITYEFANAIKEKHIFAQALRPRQIMQVGISMIWALYGATTLIIGFVKEWKPLRLFSIILLLIAISKLTLIDLFSLGSGARVIGFTVLGGLLVGASFLYQKNKEKLKSFFVETSDSTSLPPKPQ